MVPSAQWDLQAVFWYIEGTTPKIDLIPILVYEPQLPEINIEICLIVQVLPT